MDKNLEYIQNRLKDDSLPQDVRDAFQELVKEHGIHGFPIGAAVRHNQLRRSTGTWGNATVASYEEWLASSPGYTEAQRETFEQWVPVHRNGAYEVYYPYRLELVE